MHFLTAPRTASEPESPQPHRDLLGAFLIRHGATWSRNIAVESNKAFIDRLWHGSPRVRSLLLRERSASLIRAAVAWNLTGVQSLNRGWASTAA